VKPGATGRAGPSAAARRLPRGVAELARSRGCDDEHTRQVCRLALSIFDQLIPLHGLGPDRRHQLHCGAALHDIGLLDGTRRHHVRASEIIQASTDLGLTEDERSMVAMLARFHRKQPPAPDDPMLGSLRPSERAALGYLAGILRVADGLDRTHRSVVEKVECTFDGRTLRISCTVTGDADSEVEQALGKGDMLRSASARDLRITTAGRRGK